MAIRVVPLTFDVCPFTSAHRTFERVNFRTFERYSTEGEKSETRLSIASQMWEMSLEARIRSRLDP